MKISILDQAPIAEGMTARDALEASVKLAQLGDELGYARYWIAEHHSMPGLACSAPEVMLACIGANTKRIRIGTGAVLLPHYKPYKVAEVHHMLATLFPGRIDIGIGRAPGGSAEAAMALSDNFLKQVYRMPELAEELLHFLHQDFPEDHPLAKVTAAPVPPEPPEAWMLGTSIKSAHLAAEKGLAYAFGQFMSEQSGAEIIREYKARFMPGKQNDRPKSLAAVSVICAETTEKAEELSLSVRLWQVLQEKGEGAEGVPTAETAKNYPYSDAEQKKMEEMKKKMIIGTPKEVKHQLHALQDRFGTDELMLVTIAHDYEARLRSYQLIAEEMGL